MVLSWTGGSSDYPSICSWLQLTNYIQHDVCSREETLLQGFQNNNKKVFCSWVLLVHEYCLFMSIANMINRSFFPSDFEAYRKIDFAKILKHISCDFIIIQKRVLQILCISIIIIRLYTFYYKIMFFKCFIISQLYMNIYLCHTLFYY